jgi:hypothetical protein
MTVDVIAQHKSEYVAPREPALVVVGPGRYLTVSGTGDPSGSAFREAVGGLYACAYTIKFAKKKAKRRDFKVAMLEALWWAAGGARAALQPRDTWQWKLLLRVPPTVSSADLAAAIATLREKGRTVPAVRLETVAEGRAIQALHVGPYADEPATLEKMGAFARDHHLRFRGAHHEIYLSDPSRVPPERLRTILRHPVTG